MILFVRKAALVCLLCVLIAGLSLLILGCVRVLVGETAGALRLLLGL